MNKNMYKTIPFQPTHNLNRNYSLEFLEYVSLFLFLLSIVELITRVIRTKIITVIVIIIAVMVIAVIVI